MEGYYIDQKKQFVEDGMKKLDADYKYSELGEKDFHKNKLVQDYEDKFEAEKVQMAMASSMFSPKGKGAMDFSEVEDKTPTKDSKMTSNAIV
jgi:hypothetical protein